MYFFSILFSHCFGMTGDGAHNILGVEHNNPNPPFVISLCFFITVIFTAYSERETCIELLYRYVFF
jgi:hypothetical protein